MHRGKCVANNSYIRDMDLEGEQNGLQCLYAGIEPSMIVAADESWTGVWRYPSGVNVKCFTSEDVKDPFECTNVTIDGSSGVTMYRPPTRQTVNNVGLYTCCMPQNCDSPTTERITVKIFGEFLHEHACLCNVN